MGLIASQKIRIHKCLMYEEDKILGKKTEMQDRKNKENRPKEEKQQTK